MIPKTFRRLREASFIVLAVGGALMLPATSAHAAVPCGTGSFDSWLDRLQDRGSVQGISQNAINAGLNGVTLDQSVLTRDHSQKVFSQTFEEFSGRMVPPRMTRGSNMLKQYGSVLSRIETAYGVPGEVHRRDLGAGDRFRRQQRQIPDDPLAGDAGL